MKISRSIRILAVFIAVAFMGPSFVLVAPQPAHAQLAVFDAPNFGKNTITAIKSTLSEIHNATTAVATYAGYINTYVLQPLLFIQSGKLLKALTVFAVQFATGAANGTGIPQFVTNLQGNLQTVSDIAETSYLNELAASSNSPFASVIAVALGADYAQGSTLAGFFSANQCTLSQTSPNPNAFIAGDWSQGGVAAWLALTTEDQNNPYLFHARAQAKLASVVADVRSTRQTALNWGQGMMSWCGGSAAVTASADGSGSCTVNGQPGHLDASFNCILDGNATSQGYSPGDSCMRPDGTMGTIETPGSVIQASLNKALGTDQDRLAFMGAATELGGIMGDITSVMNTVNFASQLIGGPNSGGLLGSGSSGALASYGGGTGYLGVTAGNVSESVSSSEGGSAGIKDLSSRVSEYQTAWNTISTSANGASTSLNSLVSYCQSQQAIVQSGDVSVPDVPAFMAASSAAISSAQAALASKVSPVISKGQGVQSVIDAANAAIAKVTGESASSPTYATDLAALLTTPPTSADVSQMQQDAMATNGATANPFGSLTVSGGSTVDQMNLIKQNAPMLQTSACSPLGTPSP